MTKKDHVCDDECTHTVLNEDFYSDDNCTCFGQVLNVNCPKIEIHKANLK